MCRVNIFNVASSEMCRVNIFNVAPFDN